MREIKFRGKRVDNGEWVYGSLLISEPQEKNLEPLHYFICPLDKGYHRVIFETVGQYAGLKDKNGKDIYEGDIVNCSFENRGVGVIGFSLNNQQTMIYENYNCDKPMCDLDYLTAGFCKVIGNIYENPELLEVLTHDDSI